MANRLQAAIGPRGVSAWVWFGGLLLIASACVKPTAHRTLDRGSVTRERSPIPSPTDRAPQSPSLPQPELQLVEQQRLKEPPTHFEPTGRLLGVENKNRCAIFERATGRLVGDFELRLCSSWPRAVTTGECTATENPKNPEVEQLIAKSTALCQPSCGPIEAAQFSPDGKQLVVGYRNSPRLVVLSAATGHIERTVVLGDSEGLLPRGLVLGADGIIAITRLVHSDGQSDAYPRLMAEREKRNETEFRAYSFSSLTTTPRILPLPRKLLDCGWVTLDPNGRMLFVSSSGDGQVMLRSYELKTGAPGPFQFDGEPEVEAGGCMLEGTERWIPGPEPVWESIELYATHAEESKFYAWRLHLSPQRKKPRLERIEIPRPSFDGETPKCLLRGVAGEQARKAREQLYGVTSLDPSSRLRGVDKDVLERVSDGVRLQIDEEGCATTADGYYSCPAKAEWRWLRQGNDPQTARMVRANSLARYLYRPNLVSEFFDGKPLPPPTVPLIMTEPAQPAR